MPELTPNYGWQIPPDTKSWPDAKRIYTQIDATLSSEIGGIPAGGDALVANPLSQFAATTSSQLKSVISDETGSGGALVFATGPTISSPIITNIAPGADFSISQNSVTPFKSVNSGAIADTLVLSGGKAGIGTASPQVQLQLEGATANRFYISDSANINHGMTTLHPTNVLGALVEAHPTSGGLIVRGLTDDGAQPALKLDGIHGSNSPTSTVPAILMRAFKKDGGTSITSLGSTETVLQIANESSVLATMLGNGTFGFGTVSPSARLHSLSTTEQLRLGYDSGNYVPFTVSSGGDLTIAPSGGDTSLTGTLSTTGRIHALLTTEQARLSYDASNYVPFTVSSGGSLNIAPTGGTAANFGLWNTSFGTSANKVIGVGKGTSPSTLPANMFQIWGRDVTSLLLGGTGTNSNSLGTQMVFWAKGYQFKGHAAFGNAEVDEGGGSDYPRIVLTIHELYNGDMSATDSATGFSVAKWVGLSTHIKIDAVVGLPITNEFYGNRALVEDLGGTNVHHEGLINGATGEYINRNPGTTDRVRGVNGYYLHDGSGNAGAIVGVQGSFTTSAIATGTLDFADAGAFIVDLRGNTHVNNSRGVRSSLDISSTGAFVDFHRSFTAQPPSVAAGSIVDDLIGFDCRDQSGVAGIRRADNIRSRGVDSQNIFEGAVVLGGRPLEADTAPNPGLLQGQSAYGLASTNLIGGDLYLMGGFGRRLLTMVAINLGNVTVTITVNGSAVALVGSASAGGGVDFVFGASTATAATALAAAINANSTLNVKVFAVASSANVYLRRRGSLRTITTATTDASILSVTSSNEGNVIIGGSIALATNATSGFMHIPTCAGTPSGTPTAVTGKVPMVYDTSNNFLYIYNGGWKKTTVFA